MNSGRPSKARLLAKILPASRFLYRMKGSDRKIYLTFDDGPCQAVTDRLLDLLREHEVRATFFCIGQNIESHADIAARAWQEGHALGNHSYCHKGFANLSYSEQMSEIVRTDALLGTITGKRLHPFRAPQGQWSPLLMLALMRKGIQCVHWSYDSLDYRREPTRDIVLRLKSDQIEPGDILLFHDDDDRCIAALSELLPFWLSNGESFGAITD